MATSTGCRGSVAEPSPAASSSTVSVQGTEAAMNPNIPTGGGTPPELAGEDACVTSMSDTERPNHLIAGFHSRGVLPHLKSEGGTYFVTFRQAGTLPREVLVRFKQERVAILSHALAAKRPLTWQEQEELFRWYSERVDRYLDCGHGKCLLRDSACADIVAGALKFFDRDRYELRAWAVMPNHVHAVVWPQPPHS